MQLLKSIWAGIPSNGMHSYTERQTEKVTWCSILRSVVYGVNADDLIHAKDWVPCGYVKLQSGIQPSIKTFVLQTIRKLALQIHFLQFDLDSLGDCAFNSLVHLCLREDVNSECRETLEFCGHRKPWTETTNFSRTTVGLIQVNVRYPCSLTFTYTSQERQIASVYIRYTQLKVMHHRNTDLIVKPTVIGKDIPVALKWQLHQKLGNKLQFSELRSCCFAGLIEIYDGFQKNYLLFKKQILNYTEDTLQISSEYYIASVMFLLNETFIMPKDLALFTLQYNKEAVRVQFLDVDKVNTVKSEGSILHSIFGINITTGGYPNVSVIVRRFYGWEDDSCSFGGYAFTHQIETETLNTTYHQGPFCTSMSPSVPFIGTDGPKHVSFGSFQYYLTLYAFGPWYAIDVDIIVSRSGCEGIFEPVSLCHKVTEDMGHQFYKNSLLVQDLDTKNYVMRCTATRQLNNIIEYDVYISSIKKCVNFQSISFIQDYVLKYYFRTFMDVDVIVSMGPSYLPQYFITAEILSFLRVSTISQSLNATNIDHSYKAAYRKVGAVTLLLLNDNHIFGLYLSFTFESINHVRNNCSSNGSALNFVKNPGSNRVLASVDIFSLCGSLLFVKRYVYVFKFYDTLVEDKDSYLYFYGYFESKCLQNRANVLAILDTGRVHHSVNYTNGRIHMNTCYSRNSFIYQNQKDCDLTIEYRIRQFYMYTQLRVNYAKGRLQPFQVSDSVVYKYIIE